jgi:hypothetical protein
MPAANALSCAFHLTRMDVEILMNPVTTVDYGIVIAMILAISLTGERIVAIVKTMMPGWFADPADAAPNAPPPSPTRDRGRRLRVQAVAFVACWAAAATLAPGGFALLGTLKMDGLELPTALVGLLAMGGSAFWSLILGISSAFKDLKNAQVNAARGGGDESTKTPAGTVRLPGVEIANSPQPA